ncbi:MAG: fasciclin domain-containing protein [Chloroflexi bacterium]|nr:fasciclin domain-containing protein [Chloroflexota bacterium]MCI0579920.1 fasciclin domain-containing protein [Chloroflexota bacterium]MCI0646503.1 fasciclin domain-containing protein [Chloroflexota bacterium]MCI0726145.1 fasciclin domain-containing protein [Chloroflexota bacterium]
MKRKTPLLLIALFVLGLAVSAGPAAYAQESDTQELAVESVFAVIESEARLDTFESLVEAAALADNLDQDGPFTVFAPTDQAWAAFEAKNTETDISMTDLLLYHIVNGRYSPEVLANRRSLPTLHGAPISFETQGATILLNESARVTGTALEASNGVVYVIDTVLAPEANSLFSSPLGSTDQSFAQVLEQEGQFHTFLSLAEQAGLMELLEDMDGKYTLFVPTDEAFADFNQDLLEQWMADPEGELNTILSYHIVTDRLSINQIANDDFLPTLEGRPLVVTTGEDFQVYINGQPVKTFNIRAGNGVIHVVDGVLTP